MAPHRVALFPANCALIGDETPGKVSVSRFDEPSKVAGQHQFLDAAPDGAERCRELDSIDHRGA